MKNQNECILETIRSIYGSSAFGHEVEDCVNLDDGDNRGFAEILTSCITQNFLI